MNYVVLPAWNEASVIGPMLSALAFAITGQEPDYHVVLVDDGSDDATAEEARRALDAVGGRLALTGLRHAENRGLGAALKTGLYWCLDHAHDDDVVVTLDADNTQPPATIPRLVARVRDGFDLAIASRFQPGSQVHGVPLRRQALSFLGRRVFQTLYPIPGVRDYTCCFRAYCVPLLRRARIVYADALCTARGFEAVMDLLLRLGPLSPRVSELGFTLEYGERVGQSKMRVVRTIRSTVALLIERRVERLVRYTPAAVARRLAAAAEVSR